jgi:hypothetical protein
MDRSSDQDEGRPVVPGLDQSQESGQSTAPESVNYPTGPQQASVHNPFAALTANLDSVSTSQAGEHLSSPFDLPSHSHDFPTFNPFSAINSVVPITSQDTPTDDPPRTPESRRRCQARSCDEELDHPRSPSCKFCVTHECKYPDCREEKSADWTACDNHLCQATTAVCFNPRDHFIGGRFCQIHNCAYPQCRRERRRDVKELSPVWFCRKHVCRAYPHCNGRREQHTNGTGEVLEFCRLHA